MQRAWDCFNHFFLLAPPVRIAIKEMGYLKTRHEDETANLIWCDSAVQHEKIAELRNYQVLCPRRQPIREQIPLSYLAEIPVEGTG